MPRPRRLRQARAAAIDELRTAQPASPEAACDAVFAAASYEARVTDFAQTDLGNVHVFRDGSSSSGT